MTNCVSLLQARSFVRQAAINLFIVNARQTAWNYRKWLGYKSEKAKDHFFYIINYIIIIIVNQHQRNFDASNFRIFSV